MSDELYAQLLDERDALTNNIRMWKEDIVSHKATVADPNTSEGLRIEVQTLLDSGQLTKAIASAESALGRVQSDITAEEERRSKG